MAYKMKGAPMYDTSSKHGTNANYKKSGPPNLLGKILDPLGLKNKLFGGKGKGGNCPPQQQVVGGPKPVEPVTPTGTTAGAATGAATGAAGGATDPVVDPNAGVSGQGGTPVQMKENLKKGAPMKASPAKDKESGIATVKTYARGEKHVGTKRTPKELLMLAKKAEKAGSSNAAKKMREKAARAKMEKRRAGEYLENKNK